MHAHVLQQACLVHTEAGMTALKVHAGAVFLCSQCWQDSGTNNTQKQARLHIKCSVSCLALPMLARQCLKQG